MSFARVLLVDDSAIARIILTKVLEDNDFKVTPACNVAEALRYISSEKFDVLVRDLHMPDAGDGLTVVSAIRHSNPEAITFLLSAFPEMDAAATAILQQTDQILVKPMDSDLLVDAIKKRLILGSPPPRRCLSRWNKRSIESCSIGFNDKSLVPLPNIGSDTGLWVRLCGSKL